jgi:hypothetical protein
MLAFIDFLRLQPPMLAMVIGYLAIPRRPTSGKVTPSSKRTKRPRGQTRPVIPETLWTVRTIDRPPHAPHD